MAFDINSTYSLLQVMDQAFPPATLFRDTFFPNSETFASEFVLLDSRKGSRKLAPFVAHGGQPVNVAREGFKTRQYVPPMIAPSRATSTADISSRAFGESVISSRTPAERAQELRVRDLMELQDMIVRRIEWMCVQSMLFGKFDVTGLTADGGVTITDTVTYDAFTQKKTLSGTNVWSSAAAKPYGDIVDMYKTIAQNAGYVPDVVVMSSKTAQVFIENGEVQKYLLSPADSLKLMDVKPRVLNTSVTLFGTIGALNGLQIYAYDAGYVNESGTFEQYVPDGYVIMGRSGKGKQLFGAITQLENDAQWRTYEGAYVPKVWADVNGNSEKISVSSRAIPAPGSYDDWYTLKAF